jgi:hypothetical protein
MSKDAYTREACGSLPKHPWQRSYKTWTSTDHSRSLAGVCKFQYNEGPRPHYSRRSAGSQNSGILNKIEGTRGHYERLLERAHHNTRVCFVLLAIPLILRKVPPNVLYDWPTRATLGNDYAWYEAKQFEVY